MGQQNKKVCCLMVFDNRIILFVMIHNDVADVHCISRNARNNFPINTTNLTSQYDHCHVLVLLLNHPEFKIMMNRI